MESPEQSPSSESLGAVPKVSGIPKKRRNRRQRRRKTFEDNRPTQEADGKEDDDGRKCDDEKGLSLSGLPNICSSGASAVSHKNKQRSPPEEDGKKVSKIDDDDDSGGVGDDVDGVTGGDDDESDEFPGCSGKTKFLWRNVTKNGLVKKCVLVDGLSEGGRPRPGDTVLVKSQGKLKDGTVIDDHSTLVFNVGEHEVIDGLDLAVQSMHKNELSVLSVKPEMAYGSLGRKGDIPGEARITYLFGLLHFEKQKEISQLTWAQRRKCGQSRMRLANWWYQRKEYPVAVKCYKRALEYYNDIPATTASTTTPEEYKELLQLMEERLRVMRQVANIFKRIANLIQSGQIST